MVKIKTSDKFKAEKEYIFHVLFNEFLGINYKIEFDSSLKNFELVLTNQNSIIFEDHFFSTLEEKDGYLNTDFLPSEVKSFEDKFLTKSEFKVIYGNEFFSHNVENGKLCFRFGIDIFASSFFMLTRWEEYVIKTRDKHNRFPGKKSVAVKNNFQRRPVVNEYIELIWSYLEFCGLDVERKSRSYVLLLTHDVDIFERYNTTFKYFRAMLGDIVQRKRPSLIFKTTIDYLKVKLKKLNDNYDTFDLLMDISDEFGVKSHFYFIPAQKREEDFEYDIKDKKVRASISRILERGHYVGLHGSYRAFDDPILFSMELKRFNMIQFELTEGRQHFLRFKNPDTWQIWEDNNMKSDSTLAYEDDIGFRCGTCYDYSVFNILTRERLKLKEYPLIAFDGPLKLKYPDPGDFFNECIKINNVVRKYNGCFVFLWHNNNINHPDWQDYFALYKDIIRMIS